MAKRPAPEPTPRRRVARRSRRAAPAGGPRRSILWRWRRPVFLLALLGLLGISTAGYALSRIPLPEADPLLQTTFICASDVTTGCARENSLAQLSGGEDRVTVAYEDLPAVLIQAVLSAEDRDFYEHNGVDPVGIARAAWTNLREQDVVQGGSSITQQYVKTVFLTDERTYERKIKEAVLAIKLERELSKQQILLRYLNTIYFGRGAYGVQAASRAYFGKDVQQIGLPEAAYLAALIRSPESADALLGTDDALAAEERATADARRRSVLDAMVQEEYITAEEAAEAAETPFDEPYLLPRREGSNFGQVREAEMGTEYFVEYVRRFLREEAGYSDAQIYGGGLRVYTTLDYDMQRMAYQAVTANLNQEGDPAGSLVAVDRDGLVRAMVGGTDWEASQVNLAVGNEGGGSGRQPGSSFKPFVLAAALEQGISAKSFFPSPSTVTIPGADNGNPWVVDNHDDESHGDIDLIEATQVSSNTVYAQLIDEVGPQAVADLAARMGISAELNPVHSLVLGGSEVSVLDMADSYSTFSRGGEQVDPIIVTRIEDRDGNVLQTFGPQRERVIDEVTAQTVSYALNQVVEGGTGTDARISQPAAGKTGTTEDYRDAWFVGYTCSLTAAVWVGYDRPNPDGTPRFMTDVRGGEVTGGSIPADIWRTFMETATASYESCPMTQPYVFGGTVLNPELATTTTSEPPETTSTTGDSTTTTEAPGSTTTTEPPPTGSTVPPTTGPPTTPPSTAPPTTEP